MNDYIVTVKFTIKKEEFDFFIEEVSKNSRKSLNEPGCKRFDVSANKDNVFLYEIYKSENDFKEHMETEHFKEFDKLTSHCVSNKEVEIFEGVEIL